MDIPELENQQGFICKHWSSSRVRILRARRNSSCSSAPFHQMSPGSLFQPQQMSPTQSWGCQPRARL